MRKFLFFTGILSILFALALFLITTNTLDSENSASTAENIDSLIQRTKSSLEAEDELLLNDFLEANKNTYGILKITIAENGRIIADSDAQDINTSLASALPFNFTGKNANFKFKDKYYSVRIKTDNSLPPRLKALQIKIAALTLIYLILLAAFSFRNTFPLSKIPRMKPGSNGEQNDFTMLTDSTTGVVLELTGDNRIISASVNAYILFGREIKGKNITELDSFKIIEDALSKGRKPLISEGKKYLLL